MGENLREKISDFIIKSLKANVGFDVKDTKENVFYDISAFEMLYVVEDLEREFSINSEEIFKTNDFNLMSVDNLAEKIAEHLNTAYTNTDQIELIG